MNLLIDFCQNICKYRDDGCEEMLKLNGFEIYCPAEHFANWLSDKLEQQDLKYK